MSDLIKRQDAIDEIEYELEMINSALDSITLDFNARERLHQRKGEAREILNSIQQLPSVQSEIKPIDYRDCANAMIKMWIDNVLTDGEYNRIMDKLNKHEMERRKADERSDL